MFIVAKLQISLQSLQIPALNQIIPPVFQIPTFPKMMQLPEIPGQLRYPEDPDESENYEFLLPAS